MISSEFSLLLYVCGAIITLSTAYVVVKKAITKTITDVVSPMMNEIVDKSTEQLRDEIKFVSNTLEEYIKNNQDFNNATTTALLCLSKDRINQAYCFFKAKDTIDSYSLSVLEDLFKSYEKMGGNNFICSEMKDIRELKRTIVNFNEEVRASG